MEEEGGHKQVHALLREAIAQHLGADPALGKPAGAAEGGMLLLQPVGKKKGKQQLLQVKPTAGTASISLGTGPHTANGRAVCRTHAAGAVWARGFWEREGEDAAACLPFHLIAAPAITWDAMTLLSSALEGKGC